MNKRLTRKARRRYRRIRQGLSAACIAILLFGGLYIFHEGKEYAREKEINSRLKEAYYSVQYDVSADQQTAETAPEGGDETNAPLLTAQALQMPAASSVSEGNTLSLENPSESAEPEQTPVPEPVLQPQFEALYEQNPDIIGWIQMADSVDYPILWRDNTFYMDHDFDGKPSEAGAIFLDERNVSDMSDSAMLIYGHNMKTGSMFGDLDRYRKGDYLSQYPIITIQSAWESEPRKYVLVSLFDASMNRSDPSYIKIIRTSFEQPEDKEAFIAEMCERSFFDIDLETTAEDQLVTLVTCSYTHNNGRFLLFARELHEDETEEGILEAFQAMEFAK